MEQDTGHEIVPASVAPGIYYDMPNLTYHRSPGVSKSGLGLCATNPEKYHYKYILGNQDESKPIFKTGSAFHMATLEPNKFAKEYVLGPDLNKNTNAWKQFVLDNDGKTVLDVKDYDLVQKMAAKVRKHPIAKNLISKGYAEASVFAIDPETGELVKVRPDWITEDVMVDLKSIVDASPSKFFRDMFTYGYHVQAAMYPEVYNLLEQGPHVDDFVFLCVEKEPPYSVAVYRVSETDRNLGYQNYMRNLRKYSAYKNANHWPAYNDNLIVDTELPYWARREEENLELNDPSASF